MLSALLALGAAFGLCMLCWLLYGWFLLPAQGSKLQIQVEASGDGAAAVHTLRALGWLTSSGLLHGQIVLLDAGLSPEGQRRLRQLLRHYPGVTLRSAAPHP
jgi:hypothetical protein